MKFDQLIDLYSKVSKHSNYQILPTKINSLINIDLLKINSRFEIERLNYLNAKLSFKTKTVSDIGGNTGFFSFEILDMGAKKVYYYEGNFEHAEFVSSASSLLDSNIQVFNKYLNFDKDDVVPKTDIVLLFNVIHHLGDDFGDVKLNIDAAKNKMKNCINFFVDKTEYLILQLGFCWKGDRTKLLFKNGTKREMIHFVKNAVNGYWKIDSIGVAEEINSETKYNDLNNFNIERKDTLGEFRNRPIFILKSLV